VQGQSLSGCIATPGALRRGRRGSCARAVTVVAAAAPPKRRVVVTGLGCVTSLGHDKTTFYKCVRAPRGRVGVGSARVLCVNARG
jgi:hypothetical protein